MSIHLIRHAHAGSRRDWMGDDGHRPLSERGRAQAEVLSGDLAGAGIDLLVSSRFVRCVQTLEPLARRVDLPVTDLAAMAEGATGPVALDALLAAVADGHAVAACSHGDVIPAVLREAQARGAVLDGPTTPRKGARYTLEVIDGRVDRITHVDRPEVAD